MTSKNKVLSLTTIAAISAILLVSIPGTAFGSLPPMLTLNPNSFTGSALPGGEVFMLEIVMEFPFVAGDVVSGTTNIPDCDDEIDLSGDIPIIFGDETEITGDFEITIASDAQTGFYVCETVFQVNDSENRVLDTATFNIFITVLRDELILNPNSFTGDAFPGEVINVPIDLVFPFVDGDLIFGFTITGDCDDLSFGFSAQNPTQIEPVITADSVITIPSSAVIGDVLHCKTSFSISDSVNAVGVAEFNIWITVVPRGTLDITPDNVTLDAVPGQVLMLDMTFEFPFAIGDNIIGLVSAAECDEEIALSGVTDPIDGTTTTVSGVLTITIATDAEIGSFHCVNTFQVDDDGFNLVSNVVPLDIWINITVDPIEDLFEEVDNLELNQGNTNSLSKKLEQAIKNITNEDPTDDAEACEKLQSFINQLNAFVNAGKISQGDADPLIEVAEALIGVLCSD